MSDAWEIDEQGKELLQSLKDEFPSLTIEYKNGSICVHILRSWPELVGKSTGEWIVNEELKSILPNFVVYKQLESRLISEGSSYLGAYLLVNSPTERCVYETFDWAFREKKPNGFIGKIGIEYSSEEVLSLF